MQHSAKRNTTNQICKSQKFKLKNISNLALRQGANMRSECRSQEKWQAVTAHLFNVAFGLTVVDTEKAPDKVFIAGEQ